MCRFKDSESAAINVHMISQTVHCDEAQPKCLQETPSRKAPFQASHALQYGLLVVAKDVNGAVSCVLPIFRTRNDCRREQKADPELSKIQTSLSYSLLRRTQ
ncbi:LOW QUALITY PROTEIN: hypothetical protein PHMEG_00034216 [Phytophthora megakarya]|uniref:Uncharacterized protein n=1 Tax=Phytophthora megakarya TaxID=4795 RepID=A0A225URU2_9STRA|nr:LOW QUALITY PROTEIN: hypothetical protein PHMEG_00034216 [Phytophthora megakarya]